MKRHGMQRRHGTWCCAMAAGLLLGAAGARAQTLQHTLALAYDSNPQLLAERASVRAADERVSQALAGFRPSLNLSGEYGRQSNTNPAMTDADVYSTPRTAALQLTQALWRGGRTLNLTRQAKAARTAAAQALASTEQQVLLNAATAHFDVNRGTAVVELNRSLVEVLSRELDASRDRFEVGVVTRTDVAQAEARLAQAVSGLSQVDATLTAARAAYEQIVGPPPGALEPAPPPPPLPQTLDAAREQAALRHPLLAAAAASADAARYGVSAAAAQLLPDITLEGRYGYTQEGQPGIGDERQDFASITGRVIVPVFQGGLVYARVREAEHLHSQSLLLLAQQARQVRAGIRNAWEVWQTTRARITSTTQQVRANEIALDGVRQESNVGARTTLDVLNAEQELLDARVSLASARRDEYVAVYTLLAATGSLTARSLELPVAYYEPEGYYADAGWQWFGTGVESDPPGDAPGSAPGDAPGDAPSGASAR